MSRFLLSALVCALLATATVAVGADIEAGRVKSQACAACHGAEGVSDHLDWPNFAGQNAGYIVKQLKDFRAGRRNDPWMTPMALPLSDADIEDLAAYFSALPQPVGNGVSTENPKAVVCAACHGRKGVIEHELWPNLAGQKKIYLIDQMNRYRSGERADPLMSPIVTTLTDRDVEELAEYYSTL